MNQSPDGVRAWIELDDFDREFVTQAMAHGVTPAAAIRARYTTLLEDRVADGGTVRFPAAGRRQWKEVHIPHTYLAPLVEKLIACGLERTARHGLNKFGRQSAANALTQGFFVIDYHTRPRPALDPNAGVDAAMDGLPLTDAVRAYWDAHREQIRLAVEEGVNRAVEREYAGRGREALVRAALADVLLTGGEPGEPGGVMRVTQPRWVSSRASAVVTMEMRERYGKDWRRGQMAAAEPRGERP